MTTFGNSLRAARQAAGLTQAGLAKRLGVSRQVVGGWESGQHLPQRRFVNPLGVILGAPWPTAPATTWEILRGSRKAIAAIPTGKTWIDIAREELGPDWPDTDLDCVLWEYTGFPCYWPDCTKSPEENCRIQLRDFKATLTPREATSP